MPPESVHANLGGKSDLEQVKELLKAWLSTEMPVEDDVVMVSKFLRDLVSEKRMDKVYALLKFMWRKKVPKSELWQTACLKIVQSVQEVVEGIYGSRLNEKFLSQ